MKLINHVMPRVPAWHGLCIYALVKLLESQVVFGSRPSRSRCLSNVCIALRLQSRISEAEPPKEGRKHWRHGPYGGRKPLTLIKSGRLTDMERMPRRSPAAATDVPNTWGRRGQ